MSIERVDIVIEMDDEAAAKLLEKTFNNDDKEDRNLPWEFFDWANCSQHDSGDWIIDLTLDERPDIDDDALHAFLDDLQTTNVHILAIELTIYWDDDYRDAATDSHYWGRDAVIRELQDLADDWNRIYYGLHNWTRDAPAFVTLNEREQRLVLTKLLHYYCDFKEKIGTDIRIYIMKE